VSTPLFSFQDLKLSTMDIITILKDTLNITSSHFNMVNSSSMAKLMGFPTFNFTFTYQKGAKNTSLVDLLLSKGTVDSHSFHKVSHSFPKVVPNERTSIAIRVAIVDNI
jgi:hypothetical protein